MSMLNGKLAAHDIDDFEAFTRSVLNAALRRKRSYLRPELYDEALEYLLIDEGWLKLVDRFDPNRSAQTFSTYAGTILRWRLTDWYRKHPEFLGDRRAKRPRIGAAVRIEGENSGDADESRLDEAIGSSAGDPLDDCGAHLFGGTLERGARLGLGALEALDQPRPRPAGRRDTRTGEARAR